jgi:hypothetical protein
MDVEMLEEEDRNCGNCKYNEGCDLSSYQFYCSQHKFEGEDDELSENEKRSMLADVLYQRYKEGDLE